MTSAAQVTPAKAAILVRACTKLLPFGRPFLGRISSISGRTLFRARPPLQTPHARRWCAVAPRPCVFVQEPVRAAAAARSADRAPAEPDDLCGVAARHEVRPGRDQLALARQQ